MNKRYANLPGTGRGTSRRLVEGQVQEAIFRLPRPFPPFPSTTGLRPAVPLPLRGRFS